MKSYVLSFVYFMSELLSLALLFAHRSWDHRIMDGSIGMDWLHSWMAFFSIGSSTYHVENTSNEDFFYLTCLKLLKEILVGFVSMLYRSITITSSHLDI